MQTRNVFSTYKPHAEHWLHLICNHDRNPRLLVVSHLVEPSNNGVQVLGLDAQAVYERIIPAEEPDNAGGVSG